MIKSPFYPNYGTGQTLSSTAASSAFTLAGKNKQACFTNTGTFPAYVVIVSGETATPPTASVKGYLIPAASQQIISTGEGITQGAIISPGGATSVHVIEGEGY